MIFDERLLYKITVYDIKQLHYGTAEWTNKVLQAKYSVILDEVVEQFTQYLKVNKKTLLTLSEEEINKLIYAEVKRLTELYPKKFPNLYGWYSSKELEKAYRKGLLVWKSD